jgi:hypothetical protein
MIIFHHFPSFSIIIHHFPSFSIIFHVSPYFPYGFPCVSHRFFAAFDWHSRLAKVTKGSHGGTAFERSEAWRGSCEKPGMLWACVGDMQI